MGSGRTGRPPNHRRSRCQSADIAKPHRQQCLQQDGDERGKLPIGPLHRPMQGEHTSARAAIAFCCPVLPSMRQRVTSSVVVRTRQARSLPAALAPNHPLALAPNHPLPMRRVPSDQ
eukprot:scaffold58454_cov31-Tisochrysis_lutea.AAC.3